MSSDYPTCLAGAARVCINPNLPVSLAGYFHDRVADRVRDDLGADVLVLENGGRRVALVSCDLISITDELQGWVLERVGEELGLAPEAVLISASHTHTAPELRVRDVFPRRQDFLDELPERIAQALREAVAALAPATIHAGQSQAKSFSFNRLNRLKDGSEVFGRANPELVAGPAGPVDPSVQTLAVYGPDRKVRAVVVNFACHPDIIGGGRADFVSADWPGEMRRCLQAVYGVGVPVVFLQGTAGDINQNSYLPTFRPNGGPQKAEQVGRAIAGAALLAIEGSDPMTELTLAASMEELAIPFFTRTPEFMAYVASLKAKGDKATYFETHLVRRAEAWPHDGQTDRLCVRCLRIGETGLVGLPGEIFTEWGLQTKRYSPATQTMVAELTASPNGMAGYKSTTDQALRGCDCCGAYGATPTLSMRHAPDAGRRLTESAIRQLHELFS
jgi:neutral ceramidase